MPVSVLQTGHMKSCLLVLPIPNERSSPNGQHIALSTCAHRLVIDAGFLDPSYWSKAGNGNVANRMLTAELVTREGLLTDSNADREYNQAIQSKVSVGAAGKTSSKELDHAIVEILNALGWNAVIGQRPTNSPDTNAWWRLTPSTDRVTIFR